MGDYTLGVMSDDCVFCKIVKGEVSVDLVRQTDNLLVFKDLHPKAEVHLLIVPKEHFEDMREAPSDVWNDIADEVKKLAEEMGLKGFRLVNNTGDSAAVKHMHVHLLGNVDVEREM